MRATEQIRERIVQMEDIDPMAGGTSVWTPCGAMRWCLSLFEAEQGCEGCIYQRDGTSVPDPACEFCSRRLQDKYSPHPPAEEQEND